MDAHEAVLGPPLLEHAERHPHEVRAGLGVQPGVVAVGLRVADLAAGDEPGDAAQLDGDRLVLDDAVPAGSPGADGIPAGFSVCATTTRRIASDSRSARTGFMT